MMYYVTLYSDMYFIDIIYRLFVYIHFHFIVQVLSFTLQSSLKHPAESDFARQLVALSAGQVTVKLTVKPHLTSRSQVKGQRTLTDELQVEVSRCSYTVFHVVV